MNNVLLTLGALLVGILVALAGVPMMVDWNGYRGVFEEEASRLMGRDVRVGGGVNVRILPVPYVRFEKLRIADVNSTGGDPLFRAESVTMRLSIAPLMRGVLEAQSVELKKPQLRLAVDAEGRGNWRSLSLKAGGLPFVPADVSLQSVGISGGTLLLVGASGKDLGDFQDVEGELSADSVEGPFKFKGTSKWSGGLREIRFATAKPESDGATRVRASVRVPANQNSYQFDGRVLDLKGRPHLDGELTAKLPLAGGPTPQKGAAGLDDGSAFELKAKVDGDLSGGKLTDIALSLDRPGDPQLITGDVSAAWADVQRVDMALASRSLNLDWIAGVGILRDPLEIARSALGVILAGLPVDAQTDARFKADRVTLAGDAVTNVVIAISRRGAALDLNEMRAVLPGAAVLNATGVIGRDGAPSAFVGPVTLRGANFAKFASWARHDGPLKGSPQGSRATYEGPFLLDGQLAMSAGGFALTQATGEFADQLMTGEFRVTTEGRKRVAIVLQGDKLDAALLWPGGLDPDKLRTVLTGAPVADGLLSGAVDAQLGSITQAGFYGYNPDTTDLSLDVRVGEYRATPATTLRELDAKLTVERGKLSVTRGQFQTDSGLAVDFDGQIAGIGAIAGGKPTNDTGGDSAAGKRGLVRFVVTAPTAAAAADAVAALELPAPSRPSEQTIAALGAVRMAGSVTIGARTPQSIDWALDGTVDGGRVIATVALDAGMKAWRSGTVDVAATVDTSNVGRWLALAGLGTDEVAGNRIAGGSPAIGLRQAGQIFVKASGQPITGLTTLATVTSDDVSLAYQGLIGLPKPGDVVADGAVGIAARDSGTVLALADLALGQGATGVPLQGQVVVKLQDRTLSLSARDVLAGRSRLSGSLSVGLDGAASASAAAVPSPRVLHADLSLDSASVGGLLALISDRKNGANGDAADRVGVVWSDQALSFAGFERVKGDIALQIGRLELQGAAVLTNVRANIKATPGRVGIETVTANGLGGTVAGGFALQQVSGITQLSGEGQLTGAQINEDGPPVGLHLTVTSQGLNPSGLIANLVGGGDMSVGAGSVKGLGPAGVAGVVETVFASKGSQPSGDEFAKLLTGQLAATRLAIEPRTVRFAVTNGVARIPVTRFAAPLGSTSVEGAIDFNRLAYVMDWRIEATAKPGVTGKPKAPHAAVVITQSGLLVAAAQGSSQLGLAAFEQELGLRKLERDSEELERLRKLDEERVMKEVADRVAADTALRAADVAAKAAQAAAAAAWAPVSAVPAPVEAVRPQTGLSLGGAGASSPEGDAVGAGLNVVGQPNGRVLTAPPSGAGAGLRQAPDKRRAQDGIPAPLQNNF